MRAAQIVVGLTLIAAVAADVYMHNPRGSNDRNCERNVNRNNGNRLFDSQNNAKGGYACPRPVGGPEVIAEVDARDADGFIQDPAEGIYVEKMYYLAGSKLPIEWTAQHGCGGNEKEHCDIVIQYACEDTLDPESQYDDQAAGGGIRWVGTPRDGTPRDGNDAATDTIPDNAESAVADTTETRRFGMHEPFDYYEKCKQRQRNNGLFTADQNLRRRDARATRQNPNGNRNGLECPEERDYYPYWHPTPWIDIAILHDHADSSGALLDTWCDYFEANSQNNPAATTGFECIANPDSAQETANDVANRKNQGRWWNNEAECVANDHSWEQHRMTLPAGHPLLAAGAVPPVDCQLSPSSRINHLGNAAFSSYDDSRDEDNLPHDNNAARYVWTIPNHINENCVLRVRYNISTDDYPAWHVDEANPLGTALHPLGTPGLNASFNGEDDSPITQDPYVYLGPTASEMVSLAVNTNQYGRTFQDRSYVFAIRQPSTAVAVAMAGGAKLFNLNVRGKRGNIVQTYPAVEYDFVPNNLNLETSDMVHFQWTGSDYNPRRGCNNGEGGPPDGNANDNSRADRSNIVDLETFSDQYPHFKLFPQDYEETEDNVAARPDPTALDITQMSMFSNKADMIEMAMIHQDRYRSIVPCLTQSELEDINNKQVRENTIRNCAKLNSAASPYFDGGVKGMTKQGTFAYFSSRNNNFSNRDQTGRICVNSDVSNCEGAGGPIIVTPRSFGGTAGTPAQRADAILADETFPFAEKDNDSQGDGEKEACEEMGLFNGTVSSGDAVGIAVGMLILGAVITVGCQYGMRWYFGNPRSANEICCGSGIAKGASSGFATPVKSPSSPAPARSARNSWQRGTTGSALPAPVGNASASNRASLAPPPPPRSGAASARPASIAPPPPARSAGGSSKPKAASQPLPSSGDRRIPPPPPKR